MRIRVSIGGDSIIFHRVEDAGLYLMDKFRSKAKTTMGRMTLERIKEYTSLAKVERVDHSVHWMDI